MFAPFNYVYKANGKMAKDLEKFFWQYHSSASICMITDTFAAPLVRGLYSFFSYPTSIKHEGHGRDLLRYDFCFTYALGEGAVSAFLL